jgi:hypothetical protein
MGNYKLLGNLIHKYYCRKHNMLQIIVIKIFFSVAKETSRHFNLIKFLIFMNSIESRKLLQARPISVMSNNNQVGIN